MNPEYRPELLASPMPARIARLPVARGYPVPWFVAWLANGEPEFRAMDRIKFARAVRDRRCWVCGEALGKFLSFVIGPMCAVSRTTSEPPCHLDCATWSARFCPFLSRPHARRREASELGVDFERDAPGIPLTRNPGVACVWTTSSFRLFKTEAGDGANAGYLLEVGAALHVEWYAEGRAATRDEVEASIGSGLPALDATCDRDTDPVEARRALAAARAAVSRWLPAATVGAPSVAG